MPIKFACEHCGQVLSVSSTKVGKAARCPKCHQPINVPSSQEAAATLAQRKQIDSPAADEKPSARAPASSSLVSPPPSLVDPGATIREAPAAVSGDTILEVPASPAAEQMPSVALVAGDGTRSVPTTLAPSHSPPENDPDPFAQFVVYDDGTELVYASNDESAPLRRAEIDRDLLAVPRRVLYLQGVLLGVIALVSFTLGVLVGSATLTGPDGGGPRVARPCQVSGSVAFEDRRQESAPDDGSVVILLPHDARPDEKASVLGLRPDDPTPDGDHAGLAAIRSLGGDYARADSQGRYRLRVADAGSYFVLFISRNSKRKTGETFRTADLAQMGRYFADASELIGEHRYRWSVERIQSDRTLSVEFN